MDADGDGGDDSQKELERKAGDLARLALFAESRRVPLKRDEISKKVLGSSSRQFSLVFARAQEILRKAFGVEMVELQSRAALALDADEPEPTQVANGDGKKGKKSAGVGKRAAGGGAKMYILRSLLDPDLIALANAPDRELRRLESTRPNIANEDLADLYDIEDEDESAAWSTGSILAWDRSDEVANVGLLHLILSFILVEGRVVRDNDLRQILKRLRLGSGAQMPLSARATAPLTIDQLLSSLVRQGYLDRQRVGEPGKGKGKRGRGGASQANGNATGEEQWEWRWGPRAFAEVGERAIGRFVAEFMVDMEVKATAGESDEDQEEGAGRGEEWRKRVERVYNGVERAAAGAALQDVK
ncbi:MAGE-domain-containing protein [Daedalea quercina L-15889]|uniref:MAGE-domain-containing protein n=1 Tax=Daedalea quercina L-15889 TaxID=1314783 RepID=A0A165LPH9_9APHY|nr:MAGE-domain-containing protein [Daedalea quercina L-15889]